MNSERFWEKNFDSGVPVGITVPEGDNINNLVTRACREFKKKTAFINFGKEISFEDLDQRISELAWFFQNELGLKKGDRIAVQLPNLIQTPVVVFAAFRAGLVVVNTNPLYTASEMLFQFKDSGARAIVILENFLFRLEKIIDQTEIEHVIATRVGDFLGFPKGKIIDFVIKHVKKAIPAYGLKPYMLKDVFMRGRGKTIVVPHVDSEDLAFLQYTGGTTGQPKGAMLTHRNILANVAQIDGWFGDHGITQEDFVCSPLPFYHIFSLTCNCISFMKFGCSNLLITNPKELDSMVKDLIKYPVTFITGVNTLYNVLLQHRKFRRINWSGYRFVVNGGAALQKAVAEEFMVRTGRSILEGYGLTETSPMVCVNPFRGKNKLGTIGLPLPDTDICFFDTDMNLLPRGETGELALKGPQVMKGYWNRPDETSNVFHDGWLLTGDIGFMDEEGYVTIVDRKKDLILVSGFNVYPNEVENALATHKDVLESAVIGVSDVRTGERPVAVVVKKQGASVSGKELRMHCKNFLTNYKIPGDFLFVESLPKSPVGKILRRQVREEILRDGFVRG